MLEIGLRGRTFARHFMIVTHASDVARLAREHVAAVITSIGMRHQGCESPGQAEDRPLAKAELLDEQGEADGGRLSASISWGHAPRRVWPALAALPDTKLINQLDRGSSKIKLPVVT